jgi:hypothetical protein
MRSSLPIPDNPWPHDMVISIGDDPHGLVDLLWIREAWNLHPVGDDLPPSLSDESVSASARTESSDRVVRWQKAWPSIWDACVHHESLHDDGAIFDRLGETADGSPERAKLLRTLVGPSWREEFGDEALTDRYESWNRARFEAQSRARRHPAGKDPEHVSLTALVPAWKAGLRKILTIPCQGSYTRIIGPHALLMTEATREDPRRYSEALEQFHRRRSEGLSAL